MYFNKLWKNKHLVILVLLFVVSVVLLSQTLQENFESYFELMHSNKNGACGEEALNNLDFVAKPHRKPFHEMDYLITK